MFLCFQKDTQTLTYLNEAREKDELQRGWWCVGRRDLSLLRTCPWYPDSGVFLLIQQKVDFKSCVRISKVRSQGETLAPISVSKGNRREICIPRSSFRTCPQLPTYGREGVRKAWTKYNYSGIYWVLCKYFFLNGLIVDDVNLLTE